ncbi:MAG: hypothetical protein H7Z40_18805 [Phycisphaerae bacterium]|nr:hypothetical protein [Gemmatimonadaceae bacterium]
MTTNRTQEVLYESEAALRLVDHELNELHDVQEDETQRPVASPPNGVEGLNEIAAVLNRANTQIIAVLARIREGKLAIESTAVGRVKVTQDKLREVTTATEDAAINIMDACDRATTLVDELDSIDAGETVDRVKSAELRGSLRDELFLMMGALQFQDITSQQLAHASSVLDEMEERMFEVAKLFDPSISPELARAEPAVENNSALFDANATMRDSDSRQALADEIFTIVKGQAA